MPDRTSLRKLEGLMRTLAAVPQSDPRFQRAQERLAEARELYKGAAAQFAATRKDENATDVRDARNIKVGPAAAFGLGFARTALGGKSLTDMDPDNKGRWKASYQPRDPELEHRAQVEDAALAQHPMASFAGEMTPHVVGLMGPKMNEAWQAMKPGLKGYLGMPKWMQGGTAPPPTPPRVVKPGVTVEVVPPKAPPEMEIPTFMRRGGKAAKDVASQAEKAPNASAQAASKLGQSISAEQAARTRIFMQQGFPASDAAEMAKQGTKVPREALEKLLGRRLPGTDKWI